MVSRLHVLIKGRVQGVAFRYYTCDKARALGLNGWVGNLCDGRSVEAVFEGADEALDEMEAWCRVGPPAARVLEVQAQREGAEPLYHGFCVR